MEADDFDVVDTGQPRHGFTQSPRRQDQGIAARDDDLPDGRMLGDIGDRRIQVGSRQRANSLRPHHLAAKTEATIDRAGVIQLQQASVRIAVNDPLER